MRIAAKRRQSWPESAGLAEWTSELSFLDRGIVEVHRLGAGAPIVMVPGLAGGWKLLAPLAERLARRHEVILFGLRGDRGPAQAPERMADYAADLAALIGSLGLERPTVLGVSFGGAVALELAAEWPAAVGGLVVMGAEARYHETLGARVARTVLERFPLPSTNRFINQFFNLLHGGKPGPGPLPGFIVERCWETDQAVMVRRLRALEGFDVTDRLWRVEAPALVLAGTRDVVVAPRRQAALAEALPEARFATIEGAGHVGFLTHRGEVARHVAAFVAEHAAAAI